MASRPIGVQRRAPPLLQRVLPQGRGLPAILIAVTAGLLTHGAPGLTSVSEMCHSLDPGSW